MATIKVRRVEHYKIADYSFVELEASAEEEVEDVKSGLVAVHKTLNSYFKATREQFMKEFEDGTFDLD